jgi:hypothetical protein
MTTDTSKASQCHTLLSHFKKGFSITQGEALNRYGIARLASRINDLKNAGHTIAKTMIVVSNRDGNPCRVARYWMESQAIDAAMHQG